MKGIMELLGTALMVGLVVFVLFSLYQRNTHTFSEWGSKLDTYSNEADQVSQRVDKVAKALPRIYKKMKDEVNEVDATDDINPVMEENIPKATPAPVVSPKPTAAVAPKSAQPPINYTPRPEVYHTANRTATAATPPAIAPVADLPLPTAKGTYKIQVGRLTEGVNGVLFSQLQTLGVVSYQNNGNDQVVLLGNYATKTDADKILRKVRKMGFQDAFIKMPSSSASANSKTATTTTEKCNCPKENSTSTALLNTSIVSPPMPATNGNVYVLQLGASQFPVLGKAKTLGSFAKIYTDYNAKTDLTKIMLGSFATQAEAQKALAAAQKIGFTKAFVKHIKASEMKNWKIQP